MAQPAIRTTAGVFARQVFMERNVKECVSVAHSAGIASKFAIVNRSGQTRISRCEIGNCCIATEWMERAEIGEMTMRKQQQRRIRLMMGKRRRRLMSRNWSSWRSTIATRWMGSAFARPDSMENDANKNVRLADLVCVAVAFVRARTMPAAIGPPVRVNASLDGEGDTVSGHARMDSTVRDVESGANVRRMEEKVEVMLRKSMKVTAVPNNRCCDAITSPANANVQLVGLVCNARKNAPLVHGDRNVRRSAIAHTGANAIRPPDSATVQPDGWAEIVNILAQPVCTARIVCRIVCA